jgi:hypothetical protein
MDMREIIEGSEKSLPGLGWIYQSGNLWEVKWSGRDAQGDVIIVGSYLFLMREWEIGRGLVP